MFIVAILAIFTADAFRLRTVFQDWRRDSRFEIHHFQWIESQLFQFSKTFKALHHGQIVIINEYQGSYLEVHKELILSITVISVRYSHITYMIYHTIYMIQMTYTWKIIWKKNIKDKIRQMVAILVMVNLIQTD